MATKKITLNELKTLVKQIIKEENTMRHGTYMVYTQHTPDGKWINSAKILAKNLSGSEAKDFVQKNQHKYKYPLQFNKYNDPDFFNTNNDETTFPI
jgi:hypothetical protein